MINSKMKYYDYYRYQDSNDYGQPQLSTVSIGKVKMAINTTSQSIQDNINYRNATYMGLTLSSAPDDKCVVDYGDFKLKVLYVNPEGKYNQVFMSEI